MTPPADSTLPLRDILLPPPPPWWPPAPGWWLLAALFGGLLAWLGLALARRARRRRRQRLILAELEQLAATTSGPALIGGVSALLKRVALARHAREQVAALTGTAWLDWLDDTGGGGAFREGPGRVLAEGPYAPAASPTDTAALVAVARAWLLRHT